MAPGKLRRALGAVKDQTSIGLAMLSNNYSLSIIDVAIIKATRHEEKAAKESYIAEIINLTNYSRAYLSACVITLSKRLHKTRNWAVALKALMVIHRLLGQGDPASDQEVFSRKWRGRKLLNMSGFRDTSRSNSWDFTAFVRTYARYLDEQLQFRINEKTSLRAMLGLGDEEEEEKEEEDGVFGTPLRDMKIEHIFIRSQKLQQLLDRFLACRPTGQAKSNRMVIVALQSLVPESFQIYYNIAEIMGILIERFMQLEIPDCKKVLEIFSLASKQFNEVDNFYNWCKTIGIARFSQYPQVDLITPNKLTVMDEFIREKAAIRTRKNAKNRELEPVEERTTQVPESSLFDMKSLPPPESLEQERDEEKGAELLTIEEEHGDRLALALIAEDSMPPPTWEVFSTEEEEESDWETALVQSASDFSNQKAAFGGGFDMFLLDSMYQQQPMVTSGGAFSGCLPAFLALPAPPASGNGDPFAASLAVPSPAYVQMSDMEKQQRLVVEERLMWEEYARDGMQGPYGLAQLQNNPYQYHSMGMGGYPP